MSRLRSFLLSGVLNNRLHRRTPRYTPTRVLAPGRMHRRGRPTDVLLGEPRGGGLRSRGPGTNSRNDKNALGGTSEEPGLGTTCREFLPHRIEESYHPQCDPGASGAICEMTKMPLDVQRGISGAPGLGTTRREVPRPRIDESYHGKRDTKARCGIHKMTKTPFWHKWRTRPRNDETRSATSSYRGELLYTT
ncbi:hypothetical protein LguiA_036745 [Lonicera macranthoides]